MYIDKLNKFLCAMEMSPFFTGGGWLLKRKRWACTNLGAYLRAFKSLHA